MVVENIELGLELLNKSIPYSNQMKKFVFENNNAIYFDWRSKRYKFNLKLCSIEMFDGTFLYSDECSILMTQLLKNNLCTIAL